MAGIKEIASDGELRTELSIAGDSLLLVDFFATWCGPCREIAPKLVQLQAKYKKVTFLKVDIDKCSNSASRYEVRSVPTFIFFRRNEVLHKIKGADINSIEATILQHISGSEVNSSASQGENIVEIPGQHNLNSFVDKTKSECLNDSDDHPFFNVLSPGPAFLESDCDEQLIMFVSFNQTVRLHSLLMKATNRENAPKQVRLFLNQVSTPSFDDVEKMKPVQEFSLSAEHLSGDCPLPLTYVKFQSVQSITIFIKDNQCEEDTTSLEYLGFYGNPLDVTNMKDFKRGFPLLTQISGEKGESH